MQCRTGMVAQVSPLLQHYNETLQVVQLAARLHRMRRRRTVSKVRNLAETLPKNPDFLINTWNMKQ